MNVQIKFDKAKGSDGSDDSDDSNSNERAECCFCQEFAGDERSVDYSRDAGCMRV
jgi:hypothetical protein